MVKVLSIVKLGSRNRKRGGLTPKISLTRLLRSYRPSQSLSLRNGIHKLLHSLHNEKIINCLHKDRISLSFTLNLKKIQLTIFKLRTTIRLGGPDKILKLTILSWKILWMILKRGQDKIQNLKKTLELLSLVESKRTLSPSESSKFRLTTRLLQTKCKMWGITHLPLKEYDTAKAQKRTALILNSNN